MSSNGQVDCPQCHGGWVFEENGQPDSCYYCCNTGLISAQQAFIDRVGCLVANLAYEAVMRLKAEADSHPDGEGWAFQAAENRLYEHEYTQIRLYEYECRIMAAFKQLEEQNKLLLEVLVDRLDPDGKPQVNEEKVNTPPARPIYAGYDDIPF